LIKRNHQSAAKLLIKTVVHPYFEKSDRSVKNYIKYIKIVCSIESNNELKETLKVNLNDCLRGEVLKELLDAALISQSSAVLEFILFELKDFSPKSISEFDISLKIINVSFKKS
jgi:hypothetical protein